MVVLTLVPIFRCSTGLTLYGYFGQLVPNLIVSNDIAIFNLFVVVVVVV